MFAFASYYKYRQDARADLIIYGVFTKIEGIDE